MLEATWEFSNAKPWVRVWLWQRVTSSLRESSSGSVQSSSSEAEQIAFLRFLKGAIARLSLWSTILLGRCSLDLDPFGGREAASDVDWLFVYPWFADFEGSESLMTIGSLAVSPSFLEPGNWDSPASNEWWAWSPLFAALSNASVLGLRVVADVPRTPWSSSVVARSIDPYKSSMLLRASSLLVCTKRESSRERSFRFRSSSVCQPVCRSASILFVRKPNFRGAWFCSE